MKKATKTYTPKRPSSDPNKRAKQMMDEHMGKLGQGKWADTPEPVPMPRQTFAEQFSAHMAKLGSKGGKISGAKRMEMPAKQRKAIAKKAAAARWGKKD